MKTKQGQTHRTQKNKTNSANLWIMYLTIIQILSTQNNTLLMIRTQKKSKNLKTAQTKKQCGK